MNDDDEIEVEADDLGAQIRAAAEQVTASKTDKLSSADVASSPEADVPEVAQSDRPRDASGKFLPKSAVEAPAQAAPVTPTTDADRLSEQPQVQSNAPTPPTSWSADAKATWQSLPPAVQQAALKRETEMVEGQRQWSEQRQQIERTIAPLHELSQQNGIPWHEGLNRLLSVESGLRNPASAAQTVQQLAQAYGVDLAALVNGSPQPQRQVQQPQFDPNAIIAQAREEARREAQATLQDRDLNSEISNFATARGADGQPAHPHFETVKPAMAALLQSNLATTMQEAYDKAIWMNPEMRPQPQIQVSQQQQVQKARKAAVSVNGAPANGSPKPKGFAAEQSLADDIREAAAMHRH